MTPVQLVVCTGFLLCAATDASRSHLRHRRAEKSPGDGDTSFLDTKLMRYNAQCFVPDDSNPSPDSTISSKTVAGKFTHKQAMTQPSELAVYWTESIEDASQYVTSEAAFELDVFTPDAPEGTEVILSLGHASVAKDPGKDFRGLHSRYSAVVTKRKQWERLRFALLDRPDPKVPDGEVRTLSYSFPPELFNFVFDWDLWLDYLRSVSLAPSNPNDFLQIPQIAIPWRYDDFEHEHDTVTHWTWGKAYHMWHPRKPLCGGMEPCRIQRVETGVAREEALDGLVARLNYPTERPEDEIGPGKATQIATNETDGLLAYGNWEARLKTPDADSDVGLVSAFFTYRNDGQDLDEDGLTDNHEIDFELLNTDRGAVWCTVYTEKNECERDDPNCTEMDRVSARVDLRTGEIRATAPGEDQGDWDLSDQQGLQVTISNFDHASAFYTYGIEWREWRVTWWLEGPGIPGRLQLWEVRSGLYGLHAIPSMPSQTMFNLWHTNVDWISRRHAINLNEEVFMEIDYVMIDALV